MDGPPPSVLSPSNLGRRPHTPCGTHVLASKINSEALSQGHGACIKDMRPRFISTHGLDKDFNIVELQVTGLFPREANASCKLTAINVANRELLPVVLRMSPAKKRRRRH